MQTSDGVDVPHDTKPTPQRQCACGNPARFGWHGPHRCQHSPGVAVPAPARYPDHTAFCCGSAHNCRQPEKSCAMRGDVLGREHERGAPSGVTGTPAHSKSEYKRRVAQGDPSVLPPSGVAIPLGGEPE